MKKNILMAVLVGLLSVPVYAETLDNSSVMSLLNAGLGDEVVIAKIKTSSSNFELSTDQVIELKKRGVSGPVLAAMITASSAPSQAAMSLDSPDPKVPHPSGVYLAGQAKMTRIEATTTREARTSGMLGSMLTGGLSGMRVKAGINGSGAMVSANNSPVFYFYFDQAAQGLGAAGGSVTSPNEFSLIRFEIKKDKREAIIGSVGFGGTKSGLRDKDQNEFKADQISLGVYKVTPTKALLSGEYGFVSGGVGSGANATFRVFDFSVK